MKNLIIALLALASLTLVSCKKECINMRPAAPELTSDTTIGVTPSGNDDFAYGLDVGYGHILYFVLNMLLLALASLTLVSCKKECINMRPAAPELTSDTTIGVTPSGNDYVTYDYYDSTGRWVAVTYINIPEDCSWKESISNNPTLITGCDNCGIIYDYKMDSVEVKDPRGTNIDYFVTSISVANKCGVKNFKTRIHIYFDDTNKPYLFFDVDHNKQYYANNLRGVKYFW